MSRWRKTPLERALHFSSIVLAGCGGASRPPDAAAPQTLDVGVSPVDAGPAADATSRDADPTDSGSPGVETLFAPPIRLAHTDGRAGAIFDVDGDGREDLVMAGGDRLAVRLTRATSPLEFESRDFDGLSDERPERYHTIESVSLHDVDRDTRLDVILGFSNYTSDRSLAPDIWLNGGDGAAWTQVDLGTQALNSTRSVVWDDFDGDGWEDSFTHVTPYVNYEPENHDRLHAGTADWRRMSPNLIDALGLPADFFRDASGLANLVGKGVVVRDFDRDGRADIVFSAYADTDFPDPEYPGLPETWGRGLWLLENTSRPGAITFRDVSREALRGSSPNARPVRVGGGLSTPEPQMHVYNAVPADFDRDGDLDLFVLGPNNDSAHLSQEDDTDVVRFYRNDSTPGNLAFEDVTDEVGIGMLNALTPTAKASVNLAANAPADLNNDGYPDLFSVNRLYTTPSPMFEQCVVFVNRTGLDGRLSFELMMAPVHGVAELGRDVTYGDLNEDGRLDVVVSDGRPRAGTTGRDEFRVYLNQGIPAGAPAGWIEGRGAAVEVRTSEGRWAIGARVRATGVGEPSRVLGYDEVRTDFSYRSKRSPRVYVGLGGEPAFDVEVTYRGERRVFSGLAAGRVHRLRL